jgi:3-polyprenyl-4-hydroxybenzoate decarboxylase
MKALAASLCEGRTDPQNVIEGDKIDVLKFPVPRHHELDKARYIGTGQCRHHPGPGCRLVQSRLLSQPGL